MRDYSIAINQIMLSMMQCGYRDENERPQLVRIYSPARM